MAASTLRVAIVLISLCALGVAGVHLLPASALDLSAFQTLYAPSATCEVGCFMGVRPEVDTVRQAVDALNQHEWVGYIVGDWQSNLFQPEVTVRWRWSGGQPAFIDENTLGIMTVRTDTGGSPHIVSDIRIATRLRLPELHAAMGETPIGRTLYYQNDGRIDYTIMYHHPESRTRTSLTAQITCPARLMVYWNTPATIHFSGMGMETPYVSLADLMSMCGDR